MIVIISLLRARIQCNTCINANSVQIEYEAHTNQRKISSRDNHIGIVTTPIVLLITIRRKLLFAFGLWTFRFIVVFVRIPIILYILYSIRTLRERDN